MAVLAESAALFDSFNRLVCWIDGTDDSAGFETLLEVRFLKLADFSAKNYSLQSNHHQF